MQIGKGHKYMEKTLDDLGKTYFDGRIRAFAFAAGTLFDTVFGDGPENPNDVLGNTIVNPHDHDYKAQQLQLYLRMIHEFSEGELTPKQTAAVDAARVVTTDAMEEWTRRAQLLETKKDHDKSTIVPNWVHTWQNLERPNWKANGVYKTID
jgi:hypothetical protein